MAYRKFRLYFNSLGGSVKATEKAYFKDRMHKLNEEMLKLSNQLPAYQFLTAFSQLVSRICHSNMSVWKLLEGKCLLSYFDVKYKK